jgi:hypothetical protein
MPAARGYTDLTMLVRPDFRHTNLHNFLIEFKYLKLSEIGLTGKELKKLSQTKLEALEPVKQSVADAEQQLLNYRTSLESKYNNVFKLKLITVVAVGFDRLVWKRIGVQSEAL